MFVAAVTGTNGKTSTVEFTRQILQQAGVRAASFGTLGLVTKLGRNPNPPISVGKSAMPAFLELLETMGIEAVALETFSSVLETGVLDRLSPDVAAFTNLTPEHLSFHGTYEKYFLAKCRLFEKILQPGKYAVLNADSSESQKIYEICRQRQIDIITYSCFRKADIELLDAQSTDEGMQIELAIDEQCYRSELSIFGSMMVSNILCALGLSLTAGLGVEQALNALPALRTSEGRLQLVAVYNGARVYVDYAHTPAALTALLEALKTRMPRRLVLVFGCGGGGESSKRYQMGEIAQALADIVFVTDDNPRQENASKIRKEILAGCSKAVEVTGRRDAISQAIAILEPGDLLVIAGKGHEDYQIIGKQKFPFSDREVVVQTIAEFAQKSAAVTN